MIRGNAHKYPVSAQCGILGIARSTYYHHINHPKSAVRIDTDLEDAIERIYRDNRSVYGARKVKRVLDNKRKDKTSRRRTTTIMQRRGLISAYTKKKYKPCKSKTNDSRLPDLLKRDFNGHKPLDCLVSDLTYVRVDDRWAYTCLLLDLYNREIIGHSAGSYKDARLVKAAFASMDANLFDVDVFHSDRGSEFDNMSLDGFLDFFGIRRSLSRKSNPWDNAVSEATFKLYKAEFAYRERFNTIEELQLKLSDYVHWFNNIRIHSTLDYMSPVEFRENGLMISKKNV